MSHSRHQFVFDGDGTSDRALVRLLELLTQDGAPKLLFGLEWVNSAFTPAATRRVADRLERTTKLYPRASAVVLHRDAERDLLDSRCAGVERGIAELRQRSPNSRVPPIIPVIPVRMQEAWLLVSESAIRKAVSRPTGTVPLRLSALETLESVVDPKEVLHAALAAASEATGRRLKRFRPHHHAYLVSEYIEDLTPLRVPSAFRALKQRVLTLLRGLGED